MPNYHQVGSQTLLDGLRNALQNGCIGNGIADDSAAVSTLANTTLSAGGIIYFPVGTYRISANISIPAGVSLWFSNRAMLSVDSGKTVTINGRIQASTSQIFSGSGTIAISQLTATAFPMEWWGAIGDGSTDSAAAINKAIAAVNTAGGGTVTATAGTFMIDVSVVLRSQVSIVGAGINTTIFKLKASANCDVMKSLAAVDTYINTGNVSVGEHYIRLSHFSIDGNKANNSSGRGLACYWYKNYLEHVTISNCKTYGIYEGWGSFGTPAPLQDMSSTYVDVTVNSCDGTDQWYHSGPHDSKFVACIVCQGIGFANIYTGPYGSGAMFVNCHSWSELGVRQPTWSVAFEGVGCMWNNSTAEGGSTGQILIRAASTMITGGAQYCVDSARAQIGIQIGDSGSGFSNITGYDIKTITINFSVATVAFNSDGGLGRIEITGYNTAASTLYTGTPSADTVIDIHVTGFGGTLSQRPFPNVIGIGPAVSFGGADYMLNAIGDTTRQAAGFAHFFNSAFGGQIGILKSRAARPGSHAIVQNGDVLGQFVFLGDNGVDYESAAAAIVINVDGTPGVADMPGRMSFWTTPDGSETLAERLRIDNNGNIVAGTGSLATNAANGFLYIPSCAGVPSGTPTTYAGWVPLVIDVTDNRLYFYSSGAWRNAGP